MASKSKNTATDNGAVYDARTLGKPRMALLGLQHMFAMFGATVLVPVITGLSVPATLLFAGIGTLIFHFIAKWQVPAFLGSSFAFLGGYAAVVAMFPEDQKTLALDYACIGICAAALLYFVVAGLIKAYGLKKVIRYFPPVVVGPIIIAIGLCLSGTAISSMFNQSIEGISNWNDVFPGAIATANENVVTWPNVANPSLWIALTAVIVVIVSTIWGRGLVKIIPILLGVIVSYIVAALMGVVNFTEFFNAEWIGLPISRENTVLAVFDNPDYGLILSSILAIMPIAIATIMEHIGDISAISSTVGKDYLAKPGLHRTLTGDGIATFVAALFGAPANTTYGENTGVLNITRVYDPRVIRIAAVFAIILAFCPKFAILIKLMPAATIGGISLVLYGMIAAVGVRNMIESKVDLTKSRNLIIAALILVLSIGITYGAGGGVSFGTVRLSGLAIAAIVGILLNAILPSEKGEAIETNKE